MAMKINKKQGDNLVRLRTRVIDGQKNFQIEDWNFIGRKGFVFQKEEKHENKVWIVDTEIRETIKRETNVVGSELWALNSEEGYVLLGRIIVGCVWIFGIRLH